MWLKLYDTSVIPSKEVVLAENYLLSCEYRRNTDGRTVISLQRILKANEQENMLEAKLDSLWKVTDIQIELYSGEGLLKTMRGCPYNYAITDRGYNGLIVEQASILVGGKIVNGNIVYETPIYGPYTPTPSGGVITTPTSGGSTGGSTSGPVSSTSDSKAPFVYKASYDKGNGRLTAYTDHSLHTELGIFTSIDFEIDRISVIGVPLTVDDVQLDVYRTSHEQVVFTIKGATKDKIDSVATLTGTNGGTYKLICSDGWNHLISTRQETVLEVSNTGSSATANMAKITRMVYDIPSAVLSLFTSGAFASTRVDGSYQADDFDASKITIGGVHSYAWTNTQFMMASAGMAKIQILGNCVDFMNNYATANGTKGSNGINYSWDARSGWNTGASMAQSGILEITGYVDYKAPETPIGFRAMAFDKSIHVMAEQANIETDLAGYNYYVDGVKHNDVPYSDFMYDITGLENGKSYNVYMTAIDLQGNESAPTEVITIAPKDTNAPSAPVNLMVMDSMDGTTSGVHVMWDASQESDVVGYNIYVDGIKHNSEPYKTVMVDLADIPEGTHNYSVTAVDSSGNESAKSAVVTY